MSSSRVCAPTRSHGQQRRPAAGRSQLLTPHRLHIHSKTVLHHNSSSRQPRFKTGLCVTLTDHTVDGSQALFRAFGLYNDPDLLKKESGGIDKGEQLSRAQQRQNVLLLYQENHLKEAIQNRFQLASLAVGRWHDHHEDNLSALRRHIVHLAALQSCLLRLESVGRHFHGLKIRLLDASDSVFAGGQRVHMDPVDGTIYLVAGSDTLDLELASLDPSWARGLADSGNFDNDVKERLAEVAGLLGVYGVRFSLSDTVKPMEPGQRSLSWVRGLLDDREMIKEAMASCSTQHLSSLTIIIESEEHLSPSVNPDQPTQLRVSSSSGPKDLVDFLCSTAGASAANIAYERRLSDKDDEQLRDRVRQALGCRTVWTASGISAKHGRIWRDAAQLLLDHSQLLRSFVDLSGISLCLGDKYEIRAEPGIVTIPCNFELEDLSKLLRFQMAPLQEPPAPHRQALTSNRDLRKMLNIMGSGRWWSAVLSGTLLVAVAALAALSSGRVGSVLSGLLGGAVVLLATLWSW